MPKYSVDDLEKIYQDSDSCDKKVFAEMRSNILLVAGEHYSKEITKAASKLRDQERITDTAKLRLTQNHMHKVSRYYENQITSKAPGVIMRPRNENEVQDKKAAQLNLAVWKFAKERYKLRDKIRKWASDYIRLGEVWCKTIWDPSKGDFLGYEQEVDEQGMPVVDEQGLPKADESRPQFRGDFVFTTIPAYDLLRSRAAKTMEESPYLIHRYMGEMKPLELKYAEDPKKLSAIKESKENNTFVVFDQNSNSYQKDDKRILVQEFFIRPCVAYPQGYFYIKCGQAILEEGEIPFGIFPICGKGFDEHSGTARATAILKVARPFQAEINRGISQIATHQVTLGSDKIIYQAGTKLAPGALLPGVRGMTYQGQAPQILPGRDGGQFLTYIDKTVQALYMAVMMDEIVAEEAQGQDPYALLFRSMKQQLKFATYAEKFGEFLQEFAEIFLALAKQYYPDDMMIAAVGRSEMINMAEFRTTSPLSYSIDIEEQTDALDTQLGRQLTLNHILQYSSSALSKEDIGKFLRNMPFMNNENNFESLTINDDMIENDLLALERGEQPEVNPYADNKYYVKRLGLRMSKPDFRMLDPQIQQNYQMLLQMHEQEEAKKLQILKQAESEFIPVGGALIKADMYIMDDKTGKSKRVEVPYQALNWLMETLEKQGMGQAALEDMKNQGLQADIAQQFLGNSGGLGGAPGVPGMAGQPY